MNIVIILRLKKAFARPSLQANRSQPESAATSTTNKVQGLKTDESAKKAETAPKKALRKSETKTSLHTIHEEISTVSQVTIQWERKKMCINDNFSRL